MAAISDALPEHRGDRTMAYDGLDRLTDVISPMYGVTGAHYWYDVLDNLSRVHIGGTGFRNHYYCYDPTTWQLTNVKTDSCAGASVIGLGYDSQGNVINKNGTTFDFDRGNRLRGSSAGASVYAYDGYGRRVTDAVDGLAKVSLYSQAGQLLVASDARREVESQYYYLNGSLVAIREKPFGQPAVVKYQHTDALGSPVAVTDEARTVIQRSEYEPYGELLNRPLADGPGFTGHVADAATGLDYMQQRYYWPGGRFLSVDPVTATSIGGNFNRYWYANNNPYRFTDPDGRQSQEKQKDEGNFWVGVAKAFRDTVAPLAHAMVDPSGANIDPSYDRLGPGEGQVEQGGYKFGGALAVAEGAKGMGQSAGGLVRGEVVLSEAQAANLVRFDKKLPAGNAGTQVSQTGKAVTFTSEVPGRVPGSKAVYEKTVDASGTTTGYKKTTVAPNGQVLHEKDKLNGQ